MRGRARGTPGAGGRHGLREAQPRGLPEGAGGRGMTGGFDLRWESLAAVSINGEPLQQLQAIDAAVRSDSAIKFGRIRR